MTVVAAFHYRDGRRVGDVSLAAPNPCGAAHDEFVWIGLYEPDEATLRQLADNFALHPLAVEDALKAHQLPKVELFGDQMFVVARTAQLEGDRIAYGETAIFVGRNHIISVRHGSARSHRDLRTQLEESPALLRHGVDYVLHAIIDFIVDGYLPVIEQIEEDVLEIEQRAFDAMLSPADTRNLFARRREVIRFQRAIAPMGELAGKLATLEMPCIDPETRPYFRDIFDHTRRVESMTAGVRETLTSVFEVSTLLEQQRQGVITRKLAAWAAILAVPTAIAGIYGMNFDYMPELRAHYGYFAVLGAIAVICTLLYARFRKTGWL